MEKRRKALFPKMVLTLGFAVVCSALVSMVGTHRMHQAQTEPIQQTMLAHFARHERGVAWNSTSSDISLCFVTAEFSETAEDADRLPTLEPSMIRHPPRHFLFTNLPSLSAGEGRKIIVLSDLPYRRRITQSRWPKFLGWQHESLKDCQLIFYGDAYLLNPVNETTWQNMARRILQSSVGLMQAKQIGSNNKPVKGPVVELKKNARMGKVGWEAANATIAWLRSQSNYQRNGKTPVYKNALFGYDPHNPRFRSMVQDFWQEYSKETASWRDQPYWAYFLSKHHMSPLKFPSVPPLGPGGERGHNGHIYVKPSEEPTEK
jgi:hypothetical protein